MSSTGNGERRSCGRLQVLGQLPVECPRRVRPSARRNLVGDLFGDVLRVVLLEEVWTNIDTLLHALRHGNVEDVTRTTSATCPQPAAWDRRQLLHVASLHLLRAPPPQASFFLGKRESRECVPATKHARNAATIVRKTSESVLQHLPANLLAPTLADPLPCHRRKGRGGRAGREERASWRA